MGNTADNDTDRLQQLRQIGSSSLAFHVRIGSDDNLPDRITLQTPQQLFYTQIIRTDTVKR